MSELSLATIIDNLRANMAPLFDDETCRTAKISLDEETEIWQIVTVGAGIWVAEIPSDDNGYLEFVQYDSATGIISLRYDRVGA